MVVNRQQRVKETLLHLQRPHHAWLQRGMKQSSLIDRLQTEQILHAPQATTHEQD
ncbi:hypothetical protein M3J09_006802 [Ascochyta lentis]